MWGGVLILLETPTDYTNIYSLYKERRRKEERKGRRKDGKVGGNVLFFAITFNLESDMTLSQSTVLIWVYFSKLMLELLRASSRFAHLSLRLEREVSV